MKNFNELNGNRCVDDFTVVETSIYDPTSKSYRPQLMMFALSHGEILEFHGNYWLRILPINANTVKDASPDENKEDKTERG